MIDKIHTCLKITKNIKGSSKQCALKVFLTLVSQTCDDSSYIYPTTVIYVVHNEIYREGYAIHRDSIIQENRITTILILDYLK